MGGGEAPVGSERRAGPTAAIFCATSGPSGRHVVQRNCWNTGRFPHVPALAAPCGPPGDGNSGAEQIAVTHREAPSLRCFFDRTYGCVPRLATVAARARGTGRRHIPSPSMAFQGAKLPDAAVSVHACTCAPLAHRPLATDGWLRWMYGSCNRPRLRPQLTRRTGAGPKSPECAYKGGAPPHVGGGSLQTATATATDRPTRAPASSTRLDDAACVPVLTSRGSHHCSTRLLLGTPVVRTTRSFSFTASP